MSKRCMLATVVAALLGLAPAVQAKTLCVDATAGSDAVTYAANDGATACWRTLGRAMWGTTNREARNGAEAAKAGDLVLVRGDHSAPGTGRRNDVAFLSENSGTPGNPIVYRAVGLSRLSLSSGVGPVAGVYLRHDITLDGFTIREATAPSTPDTGPVVVWDAQRVELLNLDIDANGTGHGQADNHPGIRIEAARDVRVAGSRVRNVRTAQSNPHNGACIQTYGLGAGVIENNDLSDCGSGVFIKGGGSVIYPDTGIIIRRNLIHGIVGGSGITLHAGAIGTAAHPIRVEGNIVRDADVPAVRIWGFSTDPLNTPMHVEVIGNTFTNVSSCLFLNGQPPRGDAGHVYERNICVATYLPVEWDAPTMQPASAIRLDRNVSPATTWATVTSGARYTLTQWRAASGQDAASLQADPQFVSATDLRLRSGSPAQGAGAYVTGTEVIGIGGSAPPPPAPVDCAVSAWALSTAEPWGACVDGTHRRTETWARTVVTPAANGGAACPALTEVRTASQACAPPPPPAPAVTALMTARTCGLAIAAEAAPTSATGWGVQFQRRVAGATAWANHGTRDAAAPYAREVAVATGAWETQAVWTRSGAAAVTVPGPTVACTVAARE